MRYWHIMEQELCGCPIGQVLEVLGFEVDQRAYLAAQTRLAELETSDMLALNRL